MRRLVVCLLVPAVATTACSSGSDSALPASTPEPATTATTATTVPLSDTTECTDALAAFLVPGRAVEQAFIDYDQSGSTATEVPIDATLKGKMVDEAVALQTACEDTGIVNFPLGIAPSDFLAQIADGHFEANDGRQLVVFIGEVEHPRLG